MRVAIFGASGMVGKGVLLECLDNDRVDSILVLGRSSCEIQHPKLEEILHDDFFDYSDLGESLAGLDACFFCLGISAAGMSEEKYRHLTYDLTLSAARALVERNQDMTFCYVSGAGTDTTAKGRVMWARVKGATENALLELPFGAAYMFRPAYIQPRRGIRSKTRLYQAGYTLFGGLYPLFKAIAPNYVTTTEKVGRAMIAVGLEGYGSPILETDDINRIAG